MKNRKIFSVREFLFILPLLVIVPLLFYLFFGAGKADTVIIEKDGDIVHTIALSSVESPYEITVEGDFTVKVMLYSDGAQVTYSDCNDKVCIRTGKITAAGQSAVCLPARVSVRLVGKNKTDGETY